MIYCDPSPGEIYAHHLSRLGRPVRAEEVGPVFREAWAELQRRTVPGQDRYNSVPGGEIGWWGEFVREVLRSRGFAHYEDDEADAYFDGFTILRKEKRLIEKLYEGDKLKQARIDYIARKDGTT